MVQYRRAFASIRKDSHWKRKLGLGVLIMLIPYLGMVWVLGWEMQYQRNVAWGGDERIPSWSDFSGQALLGLKAYVAILPYSLVLSVITMPPLMAGIFAFSFTAPSDPVSSSLWLVVGMVVWFFVLMALTILLMPFTSSVMLRVALYGTIESGFQIKEIWRLMREGKRDLLRAWAFSTINIGITYAAMITFFGFVGLLMVLVPGSAEGKVIAVITLGVVGYFTYIFLGYALSLFLGLANMHYFGSYGRAAYRLDELRELVPNIPSQVAAESPAVPPAT